MGNKARKIDISPIYINNISLMFSSFPRLPLMTAHQRLLLEVQKPLQAKLSSEKLVKTATRARN
jgi:hypothetical protein